MQCDSCIVRGIGASLAAAPRMSAASRSLVARSDRRKTHRAETLALMKTQAFESAGPYFLLRLQLRKFRFASEIVITAVTAVGGMTLAAQEKYTVKVPCRIGTGSRSFW